MPMNEAWTWPWLALAGLAGLVMGGCFFGSLWWTVQRTLSARRPALQHLAGWLLRMFLTPLGFYLVGAGHWQRLLAALVGFLVARFIAVRLTRPGPHGIGHEALEARHAAQP
ncbi:MAG TPA: ATP synthase subunit I [Ideonella sp.]|uniref:ATP synthase subunit I n=1 Tax=Ideonella sp. TaxID=1929293 RepID=UPI002B51E9ED|nr:ATP synthase subunit I [Ideonella sp.]HSI47635.1 ATP synthase subunit I [Ideonella sp.]